MNSLLQKHKWMRYLIGSAIVALGVLIIILACLNLGNLFKVINIVVSVSLLIFGLAMIAINLFQETHKAITLSTIIGALAIAMGITLLVSAFALGFSLDPRIPVYLTAIFILAFSVIALFKAISLIYYREKVALIVLMFVIATVGITLGILALCFIGQLVTANYIILGIGLVILGIIAIVMVAVDKKAKE